MNQTTKTIFIVAGVVLFSITLLGTGFVFGRNFWVNSGFGSGTMMSGYQSNQDDPFAGMPMMSEGGTNYGYGYGMMGGGMMGSGMMNGFSSQGFIESDPISIEDAKSAVEEYLELYQEELSIGEIMIFSNHAYAQVIENETGIGAMELLVEPVTYAVYPEFGPNMMWNLKYGMMNGGDHFGMLGGSMMGSGMMGDLSIIDASTEMLVSEDEAVEIAQEYLDQVFPGFEADEHADQFYGYYTLHIEDDSRVVGMLSVNGFTRQVFVHTWHGDLIEMSGE
jgi:hypothetical protein